VVVNADGTFTYTPAANYNGPDSFTYTLTDADGDVSTATVTVGIGAVNDSPVVVNESVSTPEDTTATGNVLSNDGDIDGDALSVTSFTWDGVTHSIAPGDSVAATVSGVGTLTLSSDGGYSFLPADNYSGSVPAVSYTVSDGVSSSEGALALGITAVADAPTLVLNSATTVGGDSSDSGLPASTGLTRAFYDEIGLTPANAADTKNLESAVENTTATSTSTVSDVAIAQASFDAGDAYRYTGYVYLESGHTYTLSGNRDDTMLVKIGGDTVYSMGYNNWGSFTGEGFTPSVSGYYSVEVNVFDGDAVGLLDVNVSVDGATPVDFSTANFNLYATADDLKNGDAVLGDFVSHNDGGYYPAEAIGGGGSFISLGSIASSLVDLDGSESLAITVSAIPVGGSLSDGTHSFTAVSGSTSVDVTGWDLDHLQFMSASGFSGIVDLSVTATATEASNGDSASSAGVLHVVIADATPPDLFTESTLLLVNQGTNSATTFRQIDFPISTHVADGETLSSVIINGLPANVTLSDGSHTFVASMADNTVDVVSWDLSNLTLTVPTSFSNTGTTITVAATSTVYAEVNGVTTAIDSATTSDSITLAAGFTTTTATGTASPDTLTGTSANNFISGADGNDTLSGAAGNDLLLGDAGNDSIDGGSGNNVMFGGSGNDSMTGGSSADRIVGGTGDDTLTGGTGPSNLLTDIFQWQLSDGGSAGSPAADTITDFNSSVTSSGGDILDLRDLLVGESSSTLGNYLHFSTSGGTTTISISTTGGFSGGYSSNETDQTITLTGVDLVSGQTDAQVIADLLKNGTLVTD
jgi:hypothetical protein